MMNVSVDVRQLHGFSAAMMQAPKETVRELAKAYNQIGKHDIDTFRARNGGKLAVRTKDWRKTFRYKASDPAKARDFTQLFVSEYTRWKAAELFETGGTVRGKGKKLTIHLAGMRSASGRKRFSQQKLRHMIADGKAKYIPTPRGVLLVEEKGGKTKSGAYRKGSKMVLLAILKRQVNHKDRIDFAENFESNAGSQMATMGAAIETVLNGIARKGEGA